MDFSIPDDLLDLRNAVRDFVYQEIIPTETQIEEENAVPEQLMQKMRDMGLFGLTIPEQYGGMGIGPLGYTLITEEFGSRGGMSAFLVEKDAPGFSVGRILETMGSRGCLRSELVFEDCSISRENIIGKEGKGFGIIMSCLAEGRISYAAFCVGTAQRLLDMSIEYAKQRVQFGRPIADFQAIQHMLAEMATAIHTARTSTWYAAWKCEQGEECVHEASMAKLFASEAAGRVADSAVQIHGAMGYSRDLAVERLYRDTRLYRIAEGTSEIQKNLIARNLLR